MTFDDYLEAGLERYAIATEAGVADAFDVAADTIMDVMKGETFFREADVIAALKREIESHDIGRDDAR